MGRHNHSHCMHDLRYCEHCDAVYCTKCDREWGGQPHYIYTTPYIWYYQSVPYTITWGSTGNYSITTTNGQAVNDSYIISAFNSSSEKDAISSYSFQAQTGELNSACTYHN